MEKTPFRIMSSISGRILADVSVKSQERRKEEWRNALRANGWEEEEFVNELKNKTKLNTFDILKKYE